MASVSVQIVSLDANTNWDGGGGGVFSLCQRVFYNFCGNTFSQKGGTYFSLLS